jgi:SLOG family YspA-like protein
MILIACGDRCWTDRTLIRRKLARLPRSIVVIEGEARGADTIARQEAERLGLRVIPVSAQWHQYGRAAGPIRNRAMLEKLFELTTAPDQRAVWAFHNDLGASRGTADMVRIAEHAGVRVEIFRESGAAPRAQEQSPRH